jgi:hypothetical protein
MGPVTTEKQRAGWHLKNWVRDSLPAEDFRELVPDLAGLLQALTESEINAVTRVVEKIIRKGVRFP